MEYLVGYRFVTHAWQSRDTISYLFTILGALRQRYSFRIELIGDKKNIVSSKEWKEMLPRLNLYWKVPTRCDIPKKFEAAFKEGLQSLRSLFKKFLNHMWTIRIFINVFLDPYKELCHWIVFYLRNKSLYNLGSYWFQSNWWLFVENFQCLGSLFFKIEGSEYAAWRIKKAKRMFAQLLPLLRTKEKRKTMNLRYRHCCMVGKHGNLLNPS